MNLPKTNSTLDSLPLCYYGHPALRMICADILELTEEINILSQQMIETMYVYNGIGLAGPQVGRNVNIVVLDIPTDTKIDSRILGTSPGEISLLPKMPLTLINPKLKEFSTQEFPYSEGCLSIPGITADVMRPEYVHLEAKLLSGEKISFRCGGLLSRCLQHECDHLKGVLFIDLLLTDTLKPLKRPLKLLEKNYRMSCV